MSERQDLSRKLCSEEEMRALNSKEALILINSAHIVHAPFWMGEECSFQIDK
jgi:hypothetical protein